MATQTSGERASSWQKNLCVNIRLLVSLGGTSSHLASCWIAARCDAENPRYAFPNDSLLSSGPSLSASPPGRGTFEWEFKTLCPRAPNYSALCPFPPIRIVKKKKRRNSTGAGRPIGPARREDSRDGCGDGNGEGGRCRNRTKKKWKSCNLHGLSGQHSALDVFAFERTEADGNQDKVSSLLGIRQGILRSRSAFPIRRSLRGIGIWISEWIAQSARRHPRVGAQRNRFQTRRSF